MTRLVFEFASFTIIFNALIAHVSSQCSFKSLDETYDLKWSYDPSTDDVTFELTHSPNLGANFWSGVAIGEGMWNLDLLSVHVREGVVSVVDGAAEGYSPPTVDGAQDVRLVSSSFEGGVLRAVFARAVITADDKALPVVDGVECVTLQLPTGGGPLTDGRVGKHVSTPEALQVCDMSACSSGGNVDPPPAGGTPVATPTDQDEGSSSPYEYIDYAEYAEEPAPPTPPFNGGDNSVQQPPPFPSAQPPGYGPADTTTTFLPRSAPPSQRAVFEAVDYTITEKIIRAKLPNNGWRRTKTKQLLTLRPLRKISGPSTPAPFATLFLSSSPRGRRFQRPPVVDTLDFAGITHTRFSDDPKSTVLTVKVDAIKPTTTTTRKPMILSVRSESIKQKPAGVLRQKGSVFGGLLLNPQPKAKKKALELAPRQAVTTAPTYDYAQYADYYADGQETTTSVTSETEPTVASNEEPNENETISTSAESTTTDTPSTPDTDYMVEAAPITPPTTQVPLVDFASDLAKEERPVEGATRVNEYPEYYEYTYPDEGGDLTDEEYTTAVGDDDPPPTTTSTSADQIVPDAVVDDDTDRLAESPPEAPAETATDYPIYVDYPAEAPPSETSTTPEPSTTVASQENVLHPDEVPETVKNATSSEESGPAIIVNVPTIANSSSPCIERQLSAAATDEVLQCSDDGGFNAQQCSESTAECWCVSSETGVEIADTRTAADSSIDCEAVPLQTTNVEPVSVEPATVEATTATAPTTMAPAATSTDNDGLPECPSDDIPACRDYFDNYFAQVDSWGALHNQGKTETYPRGCRLVKKVSGVKASCCNVLATTCLDYDADLFTN